MTRSILKILHNYDVNYRKVLNMYQLNMSAARIQRPKANVKPIILSTIIIIVT